jgi:hypothetical protein
VATAESVRDLIAAHGVDGTRALISSGVQTTVQEAQVVAELIATGGTAVARTAGTGASSLVNGVASSVTSLRARLPNLNFYGRSTPSVTDNSVSLASNEDPTSSGALSEEEDGDVPESLFSVGSDPVGDDEINNGELRESTTGPGGDGEIMDGELGESTRVPDEDELINDERGETTRVPDDNNELITDGLSESTLVWSNERAKVLKETGWSPSCS